MSITNPTKDPPPLLSTPKPWLSTATPSPSSTPRPPPPQTSENDVVHIPSYSRWFSWNNIHECEVRFLPEFFDSRSPSKNPRVYMYYRNSIIKQYRLNPSGKLNFTDVRRSLVGDVGSIRRVFDFLDAWGLINYSPLSSNKPLRWEDKDSKASLTSSDVVSDSAVPAKETKKFCSGCKSVCSIACFVCEKHDLTLCARCYVRGNYRIGVTSSDFKRVEISEEARTIWTDKETLKLLDVIMHFGDDWKKVAQHVGGRTEKDCIAHFIKLAFGEQFSGHSNPGEVDDVQTSVKDPVDGEFGSDNVSSSPAKRMRLTPLADASNPIMGQVAFLSALAGSNVAEAAAEAAVRTLTEVEYGATKNSLRSVVRNNKPEGVTAASNGDTNLDPLEKACLNANSQLEKEEQEMEKAISEIAEVKMKEILEKIMHFEEVDLRMEKEWQQVEQMKNLLFVDQLTYLFHKSSAPKTTRRVEENVRTE